MKIAFLSPVHPTPFETRVFYKEARTLSDAGFQVALIAQHDRAEVVQGIRIVPLPTPRSRWERMTKVAARTLWLALQEKADVYHLHCPELLPAGLILKLLGKRVIYDAHEAYGEKILEKEWIRPRLRRVVSRVFTFVEKACAKLFDHVIAADSFTGKQFKSGNVTVVANYPIVGLLPPGRTEHLPGPSNGSKIALIYAGGLFRDRGLPQMLEAVERVAHRNIELQLLGRFADEKDREAVLRTERVKYLGYLPFDTVYQRLMFAHIGLVLLQPVRSYLYACENTTKLFEYMACGLPVICSDFPGLRAIIDKAQCGICVDPTNAQQIADAIDYLCEHPSEGTRMGENGRAMVLREFNWEAESKKLLDVYKKVMSS